MLDSSITVPERALKIGGAVFRSNNNNNNNNIDNDDHGRNKYMVGVKITLVAQRSVGRLTD